MAFKGFTRGAALAAIFNHAKPLGMGWLEHSAKEMTEDEAEAILASSTYIDYLQGRSIKTDFFHLQ